MNARLVKLVGVAGIFILLVAGYFFVASPYLEESGRLTDEIDAAEQRQTTLQSQIQSVGRNMEFAEDVREYDAVLNERFPSTADVNSLRNQIYSAAVNSDVSVNIDTTVPTIVQAPAADPAAPAEAAPAEAPADGAPVTEGTIPPPGLPEEAPGVPAEGAPTTGNMAEISLPITAEGDLDDLISFLFALSDIDRGILVSGVSLTGGTSEEGEGDYSLAVDAKTFLYREIPFPQIVDPTEEIVDPLQELTNIPETDDAAQE